MQTYAVVSGRHFDVDPTFIITGVFDGNGSRLQFKVSDSVQGRVWLKNAYEGTLYYTYYQPYKVGCAASYPITAKKA